MIARAIWAGARTGLAGFVRTPVTTLLVVLLPVNLLLLLSLFALTGYWAPTALIVGEDTAYARSFAQALDDSHHSFRLNPMSVAEAKEQISRGQLVSAIEIPPGFDESIRAGKTAGIYLTIDNVNLDVTEDVRRAIPAAAALFAERHGFPDVHVKADLRNVLAKETNYVEYLGVSSIALAAFIAGAVLGGMVIAREHELGTARLLSVSAGGHGPVLAGRLLAAAAVGTAAALVPMFVVWYGYGVPPKHPWQAAGIVVLTACTATALGGLVGAWLRRTLPLAPVILGLTLPFYLDSGSLEPQRFDGETLFWIAHLFPTYYAIGLIERAFHGLVVTPEPAWVLAAVLVAIALVAVVVLPRGSRA